MNGHSFDLLITKENHVVKIPFPKKESLMTMHFDVNFDPVPEFF